MAIAPPKLVERVFEIDILGVEIKGLIVGESAVVDFEGVNNPL